MGLNPYCYHLKINPLKEEWAVINLCVRINIQNSKDIWEIIPISQSPILAILILYMI